MKGADLKCPTCGRGASDVADDYDLSPRAHFKLHSVAWTCRNGHRNMIDVARTDDGEEYVASEGTIK